MTSGEIVRALREERGLSQEQLANHLGYTDRSSIAKIETGKFGLSQDKIKKLAAFFNVSIYRIMGYDDMPGSYKIPILKRYIYMRYEFTSLLYYFNYYINLKSNKKH